MWLFQILRIAASIQTSSCNQATVEEKLGLPPRPKRPLTPYFRFLKEMRPVVKKENPDLQGVAIIKKIVEKYKFIEPALLEQYQAQYRKDQEEYIKKRYLMRLNSRPIKSKISLMLRKRKLSDESDWLIRR